jgi:ABC-type lipoprotein release transport system permease subunit
MIWSVAWKNVWRNKIRSGVVIIAFTIGLFGGIFTVALMVGMIRERVKRAIRNEVSHIQIHHPKFREDNEMTYTVENAENLSDSIRSLPHVAGVSSRLKIFGMASTAGNATGIMINGIDVEKEKSVTDLYRFIPEGGGTFFGNDEPKSIVIGEKLAKTLKLVNYSITKENIEKLNKYDNLKKIMPELEILVDQNFRTEGDFDNKLIELLGERNAKKYSFDLKKLALKYNLRKKVVLSFQVADGSIAYDAFRIQGVYRTNNSGFDEINVYVRKNDLFSLTGLPPDQVHEIAILLDDFQNITTVDNQVKSMAPALLVETWEEIMPDISMYNKMMDFYLVMFMSIILLALGFGIVNTMLMAVLERVKEIGMLMAIGMNKARVFFMIMLETIFLALTGSVMGMLLSFGIIQMYSEKGIDLSRFYQQGLEAWGFEARLYPAIGIDAFIQVTLLVILTGIIASIYPARKALKLNPAEATRIDM